MNNLRAYLVDKLGKLTAGVDVYAGYPQQQYFGKLNRPVLCVFISGAEMNPAGFHNYLGSGLENGQWEELSGSYTDITLAMALHLPRHIKNLDGNRIFMDVCTQLLFDPVYSFYDVSSGDMVFDQTTQTFCTQMKAKTRLILTRREQAVPIREIRVTTKRSTAEK